jgi:hypothetical protein
MVIKSIVIFTVCTSQIQFLRLYANFAQLLTCYRKSLLLVGYLCAIIQPIRLLSF